MPRSARAAERREGVGDGGGDEGQSDRGGASPGGRRCVSNLRIGSYGLFISLSSYHACFGSSQARRRSLDQDRRSRRDWQEVLVTVVADRDRSLQQAGTPEG